MLRRDVRAERAPATRFAEPFPRLFPTLLIVGGGLGLAASIVLTIERTNVLSDADYIPSCDLGSVISCGSVMRSPEAAAFGFPNSLLGIIGFAVVLTTGVALAAGAQPRRWFWVGFQAGVSFGAAFVHVLIAVTLYKIVALCPYCMIVWAVTIPIFWYVSLRNLHHSQLGERLGNVVAVLIRFHTLPLLVWAIAVAALIMTRFWSAWSSYVGL